MSKHKREIHINVQFQCIHSFPHYIFYSEIEFLWEFYSNGILIRKKKTWGNSKWKFHPRIYSYISYILEENSFFWDEKYFRNKMRILSKTSHKQTTPRWHFVSRNRKWWKSACFFCHFTTKVKCNFYGNHVELLFVTK